MSDLENQEQKCNFIGCERRGIPAEGFNFFCCEPCLNELERMIAEGRKRNARHENN